MIEVCVEVDNGRACRRRSVRAESIREALNLVEECYPGSTVRVVFPISPEVFFVVEDGVARGLLEHEVTNGAHGGVRHGQVAERQLHIWK